MTGFIFDKSCQKPRPNDNRQNKVDVEANKKLRLQNVTLAALACTYVYETVQAIKYSMKNIEFGDAVLVSHKKPFYLPKNIRYEYTPQNKSMNDFNYKMIYEMHKYINTDFMLLAHYDGFVINPDMWRSEFLDYDYIGAPWPKNNSLKDATGNICRVGNSVSIRSKRLMELPSKLNIPFVPAYKELYNEDLFICVKNKHIFESAGMKFAPLDVAKYFAHEASIDEIKGIRPFAFHGYFGNNFKNKRFGRLRLKYYLTYLPLYIIKRLKKRMKSVGAKNVR
ncbi:MAG: hypothetical protein FWG57_02740 [Endomicrobia bacterium]|nr:hypothetical protein [Endomicrobiia bacterium]